jgi:hypothetical protein
MRDSGKASQYIILQNADTACVVQDVGHIASYRTKRSMHCNYLMLKTHAAVIYSLRIVNQLRRFSVDLDRHYSYGNDAAS